MPSRAANGEYRDDIERIDGDVSELKETVTRFDENMKSMREDVSEIKGIVKRQEELRVVDLGKQVAKLEAARTYWIRYVVGTLAAVVAAFGGAGIHWLMKGK